MRTGVLVLLLCIPCAAVCQSISSIPADANQQQKSCSFLSRSSAVQCLAQKLNGKNSASTRKWQWDKAQAGPNQLLRRTFPDSWPLQQYALLAQNGPAVVDPFSSPRASHGKLEPIPTQWPEAKFEQIPTRWPHATITSIDAQPAVAGGLQATQK
jgi:hypothetical protein